MAVELLFSRSFTPSYERLLQPTNSTAVMLINPNIRAIKTTYEPDPTNGIKVPRYIFKTLDKTIKPGDFVVVATDTRWGLTVVKVDEVDVDVDFEASTPTKWVISKVDTDTAANNRHGRNQVDRRPESVRETPQARRDQKEHAGYVPRCGH
jgi:hypothetical protein